MARVAIIADDLTGALDTASPFACRGNRVLAALAPDSLAEAIAASPDVVAVSTNSRGLSGDRAAVSAKQAADRLLAWRPDLVLKKVDSRLKGNIARETAAVAVAFGLSSIHAAVAVPKEGRIVRNGKVEGIGVDRPLPVVEHMPHEAAVTILDAVSDEDLDRIAAGWRPSDGVLFVCASGLAAAFAQRLAGPGGPAPFIATLPAIVAVGSRDPITANQVDRLLAADCARLVEAPGGRLPADRADGPLTVYTCTGEKTGPGETVARIFAQGLVAEVKRMRPSTMLTTGGDTTLAVLGALGVRTIELRGEVTAGLPWFEIQRPDGGTMAAVSKSGGFGTADVLSRILAATGSHSRPGCAISAGGLTRAESRRRHS